MLPCMPSPAALHSCLSVLSAGKCACCRLQVLHAVCLGALLIPIMKLSSVAAVHGYYSVCTWLLIVTAAAATAGVQLACMTVIICLVSYRGKLNGVTHHCALQGSLLTSVMGPTVVISQMVLFIISACYPAILPSIRL